ncbi:MAG TPA: substrate-binding domain-containing protein [Opitutus sp.]|nr:substrate-binding domain-containing protein [Opitutus sp.]
MHPIPQRHSLVSQTAQVLRDEIAKGTWSEWLPGERMLCEMLQVSRNTLRAALTQLQREGSIAPKHGAGNRVVRSGKRAAKRAPAAGARDVGLLSPEPLERLRPTQTLWIDELRALLSERDCRLHVFHGPQYFRREPGPALQRLVAQRVHGCWILTLSNEAIQRWFSENGVSCIVAGSVHAGLGLPTRDLDHRALCRHAAGVLLGAGHRQLALVIGQSRLAGDLASETGFLEGVQTSRAAAEAAAVVARHDGTVAGISNALRRLMSAKRPPTGLLVANAYHYLTVASRLAEQGIRVPQDVSLISRDEDPFLSFMVPEPARYIISPRTLSKALLEPVIDLLEHRPVARPVVQLMPEFLRGASIAPSRV